MRYDLYDNVATRELLCRLTAGLRGRAKVLNHYNTYNITCFKHMLHT